MSVPLVSIVIPVYNQASYLAQTIESVLAQDHPNVECIVVDDGSTDDSATVAARYGGRLLLMRQANGGQALAINAGFRRSRGDYVGYLSSDDTIDPTLVSRAMVFFADQPQQSMVVFPKYRTIDPNNALMNAECPSFDGVKQMVEQFRCNIGPGALFSRETMRTLNGWNPDYRQIPDYEFWLRAARIASFHQLSAVLSSFRVHAGSQTFAPSSFAKADESIRLASDLDAALLPAGLDSHRFRASAFVYSACLHLRSRRFAIGMRRYAGALLHSKRAALRFDAIKRIVRSVVAAATLKRD